MQLNCCTAKKCSCRASAHIYDSKRLQNQITDSSVKPNPDQPSQIKWLKLCLVKTLFSYLGLNIFFLSFSITFELKPPLPHASFPVPREHIVPTASCLETRHWTVSAIESVRPRHLHIKPLTHKNTERAPVLPGKTITLVGLWNCGKFNCRSKLSY